MARVAGVDVDALTALRSAQWDRLESLVKKRSLSGAEGDELVALYQQTAADLSALQARAPEPVLVERLSTLLTRARGVTTGSREVSLGAITRFFLISLPAAFYRVRWWTVWVMVGFIALSVFYGMWVYSSPGGLDSLASPIQRQNYANEAFESYYSDLSAPDFTQVVWVNNAYIAAQTVASGITGIFPIYVIAQNAIAIGGAGAMMAEADKLDLFFYLILPHGQLELTAIFVAGGAGLKIFWAWVAPGALPRGQALAREGRALITVAIGLVFVLGLSGIVEGFVPRSSLPVAIKLAIGSLALAAYWVYTIVLGRRAVAAGETGDLLEVERGATNRWAL